MAAYLKIDGCIGCGNCESSCAVGAITLKDGIASCDSSLCVLCKICVDACPIGAITVENDQAVLQDISEYSGIFVFAETDGEEVLDVSFELLGKAQELSDKMDGTQVTAVVLSKVSSERAAQLFSAGADRVIYSDDKVYKSKLEYPYIQAICHLIEKEKPEIFLFGATPFGRSVAPAVAAKEKCGLTADCTVLDIDKESGLLQQTRPAFGGNLMATIVSPNRRPQMATVRPGIFRRPETSETKPGILEKLDFTTDIGPVQLIEKTLGETAESIADAKIIVSAGRGIGSQKNLALVSELAALLGGEYGVTRPLVDMGWSEYRHQIGQTGCSVSPDLLICCGISGAIQHLAGISGAKNIIAINSDPDAPIFSVATYKVVGDCVQILKELIEKFKDVSGKQITE